MTKYVFIVLVIIFIPVSFLFNFRRSSFLPNPASVPSTSPSPTLAPNNLVLPISDYLKRKTIRWYGKFITRADRQLISCGASFTGYHTGDDLETLSSDADTDIPVFSIADGQVKSVSHVNGYGGLIVISYHLKGEPISAYYGHVNLATAKVKAGDTVIRGQTLAYLGQACSAQTDGERKHLHFAIHQGPDINVRGYVPTQSALSSWLNPTTVLFGK